jgi:hypothetical protein
MIASLAADGVGGVVYLPPPPETWQSAAARTIRDCADRAHMLAQIVPQTDEKSAQAFCAMERSLLSNQSRRSGHWRPFQLLSNAVQLYVYIIQVVGTSAEPLHICR